MTSKLYNPLKLDFLDHLTENLSYFLGFCMGDASIDSNLYRFTISMHAKDAEILEKFIKFLSDDSIFQKK